MALVYLGLGSNLGNKAANISTAIQKISLEAGDVVDASSLYASKPWGYDSENDFVNAVIAISTELTPEELMVKLQHIEQSMGRDKKSASGYTDRIIDIDILLYDNRNIHIPGLTIPHKFMHKRDFVLTPLVEIAAAFVHPTLNKTMAELSKEITSHVIRLKQ